jgi:hypothetical protein
VAFWETDWWLTSPAQEAQALQKPGRAEIIKAVAITMCEVVTYETQQRFTGTMC